MDYNYTRTVKFQEVDAGNVVYFANYLILADEARNALFNKLEIGYQQLMNEQKVFMVVNVNSNYKYPLFLNDLFSITVKLKELGNSSLSLLFNIINGEHKRCCEIEKRLAFVDLKTMSPIRITDEIREKILSIN